MKREAMEESGRVANMRSPDSTTEQLFLEQYVEILDKLELIADMEPYAVVNEALKLHTISGRQMVDGLRHLAGMRPEMRKPKRLTQLQSYRDYPYMKKRWERYCRNRKGDYDTWEQVMDRLVAFSTPIWEAFCEDQIFLDDWLPELQRFLS